MGDALMASYCGYCGSDLGSLDRFCGACGNPVTASAPETNGNTDAVALDDGGHKISEPPRRSWRVVQFALLAVLGVAGGVGVGFLVTEVLFDREVETTASSIPSDPSPTSTADDDSTASTEPSPTTTTTTFGDVEAFGEVVVDGQPLPPLQSGTADPAVGQIAPTVTGIDWNNTEYTIGPSDTAKIVLLVAHWCPHCQREIPVIQDWVNSGGLPAGVEFYAATVLTNRVRDSSTFPPGVWLNELGWTSHTIMDDEDGSVATAYGLTGTPTYVVLGPDNENLGRLSGEIGDAGLNALAELAEEAVAGTQSTTDSTIPGDLGLQKPMVRPDCDGRYVTFLGASVNPDRYAEEIGDYLERYTDAEYLRTDVTCSSLRAETESGEAIYAVFFGPFATFEEACQARTQGPSASYVKPLDNFSDPEELPEC